MQRLRNEENCMKADVVLMMKGIAVIFQCIIVSWAGDVPVIQDEKFDFMISNVKNG